MALAPQFVRCLSLESPAARHRRHLHRRLHLRLIRCVPAKQRNQVVFGTILSMKAKLAVAALLN